MKHYPFMSRNGGTEITFSDVEDTEEVEVYFEQWSCEHNDFDSMQITLPHGKMEKIIGFSAKEAVEYTEFIGKYYPC